LNLGRVFQRLTPPCFARAEIVTLFIKMSIAIMAAIETAVAALGTLHKSVMKVQCRFGDLMCFHITIDGV
jgi:hypothetical protein